MQKTCIRQQALAALLEPDPQNKSELVRHMQGIQAPLVDIAACYVAPAGVPGRPDAPLIVSPQNVPHRGLGSVEGRAGLLHALAHIEFNAINLALDIMWRFAGMPEAFYGGWLNVAAEEVYHFNLLRDYLRELGFDYGAFPAHDGLWDMAARTEDDLLARLALVPRTLEARGLDACPIVRNRLAQVGDEKGAAILDIILRDEVGHVALGNYWYRWQCAQQGVDPITMYPIMAEKFRAPTLKGPFNIPARLEAGFEQAELDWLEQQDNTARKRDR